MALSDNLHTNMVTASLLGSTRRCRRTIRVMTTSLRRWAIALGVGALVLVVAVVVIYAMFLFGLAYLFPPAD